MVRHSLGFSSRLYSCLWNYTIVCLHLSRLLCFVHIHGMRVCSWVFVFLCSHLYALLFGSFHLSHRSHSSVCSRFCLWVVCCVQSVHISVRCSCAHMCRLLRRDVFFSSLDTSGMALSGWALVPGIVNQLLFNEFNPCWMDPRITIVITWKLIIVLLLLSDNLSYC